MVVALMRVRMGMRVGMRMSMAMGMRMLRQVVMTVGMGMFMHVLMGVRRPVGFLRGVISFNGQAGQGLLKLGIRGFNKPYSFTNFQS